MLKYSILVLEQDVYIGNKEEIIDEKGGNNPFSLMFLQLCGQFSNKMFLPEN